MDCSFTYIKNNLVTPLFMFVCVHKHAHRYTRFHTWTEGQGRHCDITVVNADYSSKKVGHSMNRGAIVCATTLSSTSYKRLIWRTTTQNIYKHTIHNIHA